MKGVDVEGEASASASLFTGLSLRNGRCGGPRFDQSMIRMNLGPRR